MIFKRIINTSFNDRIIRLLLAIIFFLIAFFWVSGALEFLFYFFGVVILITSFTGVCRIYRFLGISSCKNEKFNIQKVKKSKKYLWVIIILLLIFLGSYFSIFFTDKIFLKDFEKFNSAYKQALVYSEQNDHAKAIDYYSVFKLNFDSFKDKYSNYKPYSIRWDRQFGYDIIKINMIIGDVDKTIDSSNLTIANQQLKEIDPILKNMIKRNGF
jgi:hypothetical protein